MSEVINHNILTFQGQLTYDQINILLDDLQSRLEEYAIDTVHKKRLYSSAVEALENILRHSQSQAAKNYHPIFEVSFAKNDSFIIKICNIVNKNQQDLLSERINFINKNFGQLKRIFAKKLKSSRISQEGGAGLGMYIIGKNSSERLTYSFTDINKKQSYFCLKIKI